MGNKVKRVRLGLGSWAIITTQDDGAVSLSVQTTAAKAGRKHTDEYHVVRTVGNGGSYASIDLDVWNKGALEAEQVAKVIEGEI